MSRSLSLSYPACSKKTKSGRKRDIRQIKICCPCLPAAMWWFLFWIHTTLIISGRRFRKCRNLKNSWTALSGSTISPGVIPAPRLQFPSCFQEITVNRETRISRSALIPQKGSIWTSCRKTDTIQVSILSIIWFPTEPEKMQ